jgi:hypothetical protein
VRENFPFPLSQLLIYAEKGRGTGHAEHPPGHEVAMKTRFSNQRIRALTRTDVVVVLVTCCLLVIYFAYALAVLRSTSSHGRPVSCINNLKQIGIAYRLWEGDHNDKYPMAVSVTNGGAMELIATGNVAACFRVMSNELSTPKLLICPADSHRKYATNFSALRNSNISYFVGFDAAEIQPQMLLSGDDNFALDGVPVKSGVVQIPTSAPVMWTKGRHAPVGNLGMADGSVQQVTANGLEQALIQTGVATNRLAIP